MYRIELQKFRYVKVDFIVNSLLISRFVERKTYYVKRRDV